MASVNGSPQGARSGEFPERPHWGSSLSSGYGVIEPTGHVQAIYIAVPGAAFAYRLYSVDLGLLSHILECEGSAHFPCQACRQGTNLRVYVGEVRQRRPPPHPHYGAIRRSTELEGHGSTGPKTVRGDAVECVTSQKETIIYGSPSYCNSNITVCHFRDGPRPVVNRIERACQWAEGNVRDSSG